MDESLDAWFKHEIVVHEEALMRFLRRSWPNRNDLHDLRQETYIRVFEAAAKARPTMPKAFLFATAKYLMIDRIRHRQVVTIDTVGDLESLNVTPDDISPERHTAARQELRILAQAFDNLPPKCREAVWMRRVDYLPQKEVAARLGVTEKTVEKHLMKGMKRLADALFGNERGETTRDGVRETDNEREHGKQHRD